jgi:DnaJ family protein B protein 4
VISPGYEKLSPKEGMPISKVPGRRGNLRIKFDIKFPIRLTTEQKAGFKRLLGGADGLKRNKFHFISDSFAQP